MKSSTFGHTLSSLLLFAVIVPSCARKAPSPPATFTAIADAATDARVADAGPVSSSDDEVVDMSLPKGCAELYQTTDVCKRIRNMIGAGTRMRNRACLARIGAEFPLPSPYRWGCAWVSFTKLNVKTRAGYGMGPDCFADRFDGEGVICGIQDDHHPDDDTVYFEATEDAVRQCLSGWQEETKASTKRFGDRAFAFSKALDPAQPAVVARVQGCRDTSPPESIDDRKHSYMRFEIFSERIAPKP